MAATIASPSAPGTSSRKPRARRNSQPCQAPPIRRSPSFSPLDDAAFRARFRGSPIKRIGRDRFIRNVAVAAGNSGEPALLTGVLPLLADPSPLVRGMAVWAVRRLAKQELAEALKAKHCADERDASVLAEWDCAL